MMFARILKESSALNPGSVRSLASRKAWLKRQRARHMPSAKKSVSMADYYDQHDDPNITEESVLDSVGVSKEDRAELFQAIERAKKAPTSAEEYTYKDGPRKGEYTDERRKLHEHIIATILSDEAIAAATPADGEAPTFVVLGGRGGSGKSSFSWGKDRDGNPRAPRVNEFDSRKFLVLDSDAIKEMLKPPYAGWNAFSVHEESSMLFDHIMFNATAMGLNVVQDATLKSASVKSTLDLVKSQGYRVEGHYMFVPRQTSAARAIERYLGRGPHDRGRLVPPSVILENTKNERNFDSLKPYFDKWSAYDNQGSGPVLIDRHEN